MKNLPDAVLWAMYVPSVALTLRATYFWVRSYALPAIKTKDFSIRDHLIGATVIFLLCKQALSDVLFGSARVLDTYAELGDSVPLIFLLKLLGLAAVVCVLAAVKAPDEAGHPPLRKVLLKAGAWWCLGFALYWVLP